MHGDTETESPPLGSPPPRVADVDTTFSLSSPDLHAATPSSSCSASVRSSGPRTPEPHALFPNVWTRKLSSDFGSDLGSTHSSDWIGSQVNLDRAGDKRKGTEWNKGNEWARDRERNMEKAREREPEEERGRKREKGREGYRYDDRDSTGTASSNRYFATSGVIASTPESTGTCPPGETGRPPTIPRTPTLPLDSIRAWF